MNRKKMLHIMLDSLKLNGFLSEASTVMKLTVKLHRLPPLL
jgi:hypothetical protein